MFQNILKCAIFFLFLICPILVQQLIDIDLLQMILNQTLIPFYNLLSIVLLALDNRYDYLLMMTLYELKDLLEDLVLLDELLDCTREYQARRRVEVVQSVFR